MEKGIEVFLESIKEKLLYMSSLASKAVQNSVKGLLENDEKVAKSVIEEDKYINNLEVEIDSLGLEFLARYQPEASDLRFVIAVLRMNTDI
ncbi:MAG TPA: PhoU domain-containing protein, partial [Caldisericia bacterium]|nr:PhoU domain-containing protein [Caldisericia bacterium]